MSVSDDLDRVIRALHALKSKVEELEVRQPVLDPRNASSVPDDNDPFAQLFGARRGVHFRTELHRIEQFVEQISVELRRLR